VRIQLTDASWLLHEPGFLSPDEADAALEALSVGLSWEQRHIVLFGRRILQPRLIAWAGDIGYRYSGQTLEPRPMPAILKPVLERIVKTTGLELNHVLLNRYRDEHDSMGFHSDDEAELGPEPQLATLSLGATRRLALAAKRKSTRLPLRHVELGHGDLLVMAGAFQHELRHGVPRTRAPTGERISLTFRRLLRAPG
jgi:alkylated DNA repair dioxygenase AlkB